MNPDLTPLGIFHTALSIVAIVSGAIALYRNKQITLNNRLGQVYVVTTLITCLTAFGIFRHGGFGPGHWLTVVTLVTLLVGTLAEKSTVFGGVSAYVGVISFSFSFFLSMIFTVTEALTRLPPEQPLAANQEAPILLAARGILLLAFVIGVFFQVRRLRTVGS